MAWDKKIVDAVRAAYIYSQLPLEQAAAKYQIPTGTVRRWKDKAKNAGDDWDKLQAAYTLAGDGLESVSRQVLMGFLLQHQAVMEQLQGDTELSAMQKADMLTSMADAFNKAVSASAKVLPETNRLAVAMETVRAFGDYVRERHPARAMDFIDMIQAFAPELQKRFA